MILAELFTMTEIEAPAERVWHILTDFARYPEWNPFIRCIEGEPVRRPGCSRASTGSSWSTSGRAARA